MATLVLTTVGSIIGGPVGGAIGAIIGQQVDQRLFAPSGREGPRLTDLAVQTSRYGSAIPKLYGAVRVSGTVIWSTDLIETRSSRSTGKGRPRTTSYSYAASFAVALSARAILRIGRIWADGNLLRGAAGDFKTPCTFRLLLGSEDQALDPLIAAAEGLATTPAYRGRAVAIFEDLQLADFGNRIPSLSFEVFADDAPTSIAAVLTELSQGAITGTGEALIDGIAIQGDSVRSVVATLAAAAPIALRDDGAVLGIVDDGPVRAIAADDLGASAGAAGVRIDDRRAAVATIPEALAIAYYDTERDFQAGVQRARRDGGSRREVRIDLAASLTASTAKAIAERRLTGLWRARRTVKLSLPWSAIDLRPGDAVTFPGDATIWHVAETTLERMAVHAVLVPAMARAMPSRAAESGRNTAQADLVQGPTILAVIDLPPLSDSAETAPKIVVAATGATRGWRAAPLLASNDSGASFTAIGITALPATIGTTTTRLADGTSYIADRINTVDVLLANDALVLIDADDAALIAGGNLAMIGRECLQFSRATPLGGNRWRLSGLWRGRRGTDFAMANHAIGETFVLIEADALAPIPDAFAVDGARILAVATADGAGSGAVISQGGAAITPLSPVHPAADDKANGDIEISWVRRSREGWRWADAVDAPIGEAGELYRITRAGSGVAALTVESVVPYWSYSAAQIAIDRAAGVTGATIAIAQVGTWRVSPLTEISLSLN